jgi:hypothetical protein
MIPKKSEHAMEIEREREGLADRHEGKQTRMKKFWNRRFKRFLKIQGIFFNCVLVESPC